MPRSWSDEDGSIPLTTRIDRLENEVSELQRKMDSMRVGAVAEERDKYRAAFRWIGGILASVIAIVIASVIAYRLGVGH